MLDINPAYLSNHNLVNAKEADIDAENAPLWSLEYIFLARDHGKPYKEMLSNLRYYIDKCATPVKGLYNQFPTRYNNKDDSMSPDQLIAFAGALHINGEKHKVKEIHKYLVKHLMTYDNLNPNKINFNAIMQPQATTFVGVASGAWYLWPALTAAILVSCATELEETSGKLKSWTMMKALDMKWTMRTCTFMIKRGKFKTWKEVFAEYFKEAENPIRKLSEEYL